jgi:nicotinate-nucleotide adenylyltransferase
MKRIGIFGGSFNPVHNGHLRLAEHALSEFNLDKVYFVPSGRTPLKDPASLLPAALRTSLLREALRGKKAFAVSDCEIRRGGTSYTLDTLKEFRRRLGPAPVLYFLCGADTAKNLSRWKSPGKVIKLCRFMILSRPGAAKVHTPPGVLWAAFPALDISSSDVRARLKAGRSLRGLVPPAVERKLKNSNRKGLVPSKSRKSSR